MAHRIIIGNREMSLMTACTNAGVAYDRALYVMKRYNKSPQDTFDMLVIEMNTGVPLRDQMALPIKVSPHKIQLQPYRKWPEPLETL